MDTEVLATLHSFLLRFHADRAAGAVRSRDSYLRQFPRFGEHIAREYDALIEGTPASTVDDPHGIGEPQAIGPYELLREISRGGQGVVYLARDTRLRRKVALKVLPPSLTADASRFARFQREAAAASRIDHPGICTIYETGVAAGVPFIAMRFIEGQTLAQRIADARAATGRGGGDQRHALPSKSGAQPSTSARDAVRVSIQLIEHAARALHVAHEAGVVHRDIKPGNLMVTSASEPVILDFGLARDSDSEAGVLTHCGDRLGTPAYMSPEQIQPGERSIDRRTDVYSLGVMLFEAVTLERPFDSPTREGLYHAICSANPPDLTRLTPAAPRDLRTVIDTALEKDRDRRYQTALDLAEDLRAVLELRPIRARPLSTVGRIARWVRREPARASLIAAVALLVPTLASVGGYTAARLPEIEAGRKAALQVQIDRELDAIFMAVIATAVPARAEVERLRTLDRNHVVSIGAQAFNAAYTPEGRLAALDSSVTTCSSPNDLAITRATWLREAGRFEEAIALEKVIGPSETGIGYFLRGVNLASGFSEGNRATAALALSNFTKANFLAPRPRLAFQAACANAAGRANDLRAFHDSETMILQCWPESAERWFAISYAYRWLDPEMSVTAAHRALELNPTLAVVWSYLGDVERGRASETSNSNPVLARARLAEAERCHRRTVELDPTNAWFHYRLAWTLKDSDDPCDREEAERAAMRAVELVPDDPHYAIGVSTCRRIRGDLAGAFDALLPALEICPTYGLLHLWMAEIRLAQGRPEEARAAAEIAVEIEPQDMHSVRALARAHKACGDLASARVFCQRAVELNEQDGSTSMLLCDTLRASGDFEALRAEYERCTRVLPEDPQVWNSLAWFLVDPNGDPRQLDSVTGLVAAERAMRLSDRSDADVTDTFAQALFVNGRVDEAIATQERAIELLREDGRPQDTVDQFKERLDRFRAAKSAR